MLKSAEKELRTKKSELKALQQKKGQLSNENCALNRELHHLLLKKIFIDVEKTYHSFMTFFQVNELKYLNQISAYLKQDVSFSYLDFKLNVRFSNNKLSFYIYKQDDFIGVLTYYNEQKQSHINNFYIEIQNDTAKVLQLVDYSQKILENIDDILNITWDLFQNNIEKAADEYKKNLKEMQESVEAYKRMHDQIIIDYKDYI